MIQKQNNVYVVDRKDLIAYRVEAVETEQPETKQEYYRINLKLPLECKEYLQEMTWRTRSKSITAYLTALIEKDMEQHPDWR